MEEWRYDVRDEWRYDVRDEWRIVDMIEGMNGG